jgi:hypothetical protein
LSTSLRTWRTMRSKDGCRKKLFRRWNIHWDGWAFGCSQ